MKRAAGVMALALALAAAAACGDDDPVAAPGASSDAGTIETGVVVDDNPILPLSPVAKIGFEESPFPIDTHGMSLERAEQVGLGSYIVNTQSDCKGCHGHLKPGGVPILLGGGVRLVIAAKDGRSSAIVYTRNLTSDPNYGMRLTEAEFIETMRTGRDFKNPGQQLLVMPWFTYRWMSDTDLKALYAYLQLVPADPYPVPADIKGTLASLEPIPFPGKFIDGDMDRPLPADEGIASGNPQRGLAIEPRVSPPGWETMTTEDRARYARGSYIVNALADCNQCHTELQRDFDPKSKTYLKINTANYFAGGRRFDVPSDLFTATLSLRTECSNLTGEKNGLFGSMTLDMFKHVLNDKVFIDAKGNERPLRFPMFLQPYSLMTDEDITAIYTYVKAQKPITGAADKLTQPPAHYCEVDEHCPKGETCAKAQNQCIGRTCATDIDCDSCHTCSAQKLCVPPGPKSACVARSAVMW